MGSPRAEFDLVLAAPDPLESEMARELLSRVGIPSLVHGQDRDFAELGCAGHRSIARPDLYVPRGLGDRARALLREAWDPASLTDELALACPAEEAPRTRARLPVLLWLLFAAALALAIAFSYAGYLDRAR